jgi:hypothetical protein
MTWTRAAFLVGAASACSGAMTKTGELIATDAGDDATTGDVSSVALLNDGGELECTATPISGLQVYNEMATAGYQGETCSGTLKIVAAKGVTWKSSMPGTDCADQLECAPTCCACATTGISVVASWCNSGKCATPEDTCCALAGTYSKSCDNCMAGPNCGNQ